jgi:hypothetical protein
MYFQHFGIGHFRFVKINDAFHIEFLDLILMALTVKSVLYA